MNLHHETISLDREFSHTPAQVMKAFSTAKGYAAWSSPAIGCTVTCDPFDFREGGVVVVNMDMGDEGGWTNTDRFLVIKPGHIVQSTTLEGPPGLECASMVSLELFDTPGGCRMKVTEQGTYFMGAEGAGMHKEGWQSMLDNFASYLADEYAE